MPGKRKIKVVRQHDSMQCGAACLATVCSYYGKKMTLDDAERFCHCGKRGVSLLGVSEAAQDLGFHTRASRMTLRQLGEITLPCILYWNRNHFVVLHRIRRGRYYIADPGKGLLSYSRDEFLGHWASSVANGYQRGIALVLEPTAAFSTDSVVPGDGKRRTAKGLLGHYIGKYRAHLGVIAAGLAVASLLQLLLPFLTQSIVDVGIKGSDIGFVWLVLLGEFMIVAGTTMTDFIRRWILLHISMRINISLLSDFFIKLLKLPMSFFDTKLKGDLLQRMGDHSRVQSFLTDQVLGMVFNIFNFIVFGVVLLIYSRLIFLVFIAGSALYLGWICLFFHRRKMIDIELFSKSSENQSATYEFITTMQETKLQDCCQRRRWHWEGIQAEIFELQMRSLRLQQAQEAGSVFINEMKNLVITALSATAVIEGTLSLGSMLAIQYITGQLNSPVSRFITFLFSSQDVGLSINRINEIHERAEEDAQRNLYPPDDREDAIELRDVSFRYDRHSDRDVLKGVSVVFPKNRITALVGASGSGKTTMIKLMLGYYDHYEGEIFAGGMDFSNVNLRGWRRKCGVVMQDGVIFSESIARNIANDDSDVDQIRMVRAAQLACIHDFVMSLPLKYETVIGPDGIGISQGQRQRILIARAVYRDPDFIFLDEATNSLDTTNERRIVENLNRFYRDRTVVVVAHRLSTVRNADCIVVMDKGMVRERGTHEELIARRGVYYDLIQDQLHMGD